MDKRWCQDMFLDQGNDKKSKGDVFHGHRLHQIPLLDRFADRLASLYSAGTARVQLGTNTLK
jgi:hypothetical protein